jgi:hypothetical protein
MQREDHMWIVPTGVHLVASVALQRFKESLQRLKENLGDSAAHLGCLQWVPKLSVWIKAPRVEFLIFNFTTPFSTFYNLRVHLQ